MVDIMIGGHKLGEGFISCREQMPEEGQPVYYYFELLGTFEGKYYGDNCFGGKMGFLTDDVTHWKPRDND